MARVIDYAWGRPSIAALRAAGAVAVCRYLAWPGPSTDGKLLTLAEAQELNAAGIAIVSNWEQAGSWTELSRGEPEGAAHAAQADLQHRAAGGPPRRPIYFSADFDATDAQLPTIADYYRGVASVIGLDRTGAYGGYRTIKYLADHGVIRWAWQTFAWSGGLWDPRAHLRQIHNDVTIDGVSCDLNDAMTTDFGQWGTGDPVSDFTNPTYADGLAWRMDALLHTRDKVIGGPTVGEPVELVGLVKQTAADVAALKAGQPTPAPVALTDEQVTALATQIGAHLDERFAKLEAAVAKALEAAATVLGTPPA